MEIFVQIMDYFGISGLEPGATFPEFFQFFFGCMIAFIVVIELFRAMLGFVKEVSSIR